ncbi:MAG TPA: hypothetical protein VFP70_14075 [Burkholderiales bacterium]|nr:hypothetical protein [Burkholderiales bacterium]
MRAPKLGILTMGRGFVPMPDPSLVEQLEFVPVAALAMNRSPCDRAGRVQLLREAYVTLLRKEAVPSA